MKCQQVQEYIDNLLVTGADVSLPAAAAEHAAGCPRCRQDCDTARRVLAQIQPSQTLIASPRLKEKIMSEIHRLNEMPAALSKKSTRLWRRLALTTAALVLIVLGSLFFPLRMGLRRTRQSQGARLYAQAWAAERAMFAGDAIVHLTNRIIVKSVSDPNLAEGRWFFFVSVDAGGRIHNNRLNLGGKPGEESVVAEDSWYDPGERRFVRLFSMGGRPIYANSYEGGTVFSLEPGKEGRLELSAKPVSAGFRLPENPAPFLGLLGGMQEPSKDQDALVVSEVQSVRLADGAPARVIRFVSRLDSLKETGFQLTVRDSDKSVAAMEWVIKGESLFTIQRVAVEKVPDSQIDWKLRDAQSRAAASPAPTAISIIADALVSDVSVESMRQDVDFEPYLFAANPVWTTKREIISAISPADPPKRFIMVVYVAQDQRHVVLSQSRMWNSGLGPRTAKSGKLVYESPAGVKVWSGDKDKWLAEIMLMSARGSTGVAPSADRTGYVLEAPGGVFPLLAINGQLTNDELHTLVDSLIPARRYLGR